MLGKFIKIDCDAQVVGFELGSHRVYLTVLATKLKNYTTASRA